MFYTIGDTALYCNNYLTKVMSTDGTVEGDNTTIWLLAVWASNGPMVLEELTFDPSTKSHTYTVLINQDTTTDEEVCLLRRFNVL